MQSFLKRNMPVFVIGFITFAVFLGIIFRGETQVPDAAESPYLKKVSDDTSDINETATYSANPQITNNFTDPETSIQVVIPEEPVLSPEEVDAQFGVAEVFFRPDGFEPIEIDIEPNQLVRWTNETDREITIYQTSYKKYDEWETDAVIPPGGTFEFRFYKPKIWTYKERESMEFGSVFVKTP